MSSSFAWSRIASLVRCRKVFVVAMLAIAWACGSCPVQGAEGAKEDPTKKKPAAVKPVEVKSNDGKPSDGKATETKPAEKKVEATKADAKNVEAKKPDAKKVDPKSPVGKKPTATKPTTSKPAVKKFEQPLTPGGKYRAHDMQRPRPKVVTPPTASTDAQAGAPPSDAIVLFDGKSLAAWLREGRDPVTKQPLTTPAAWPVRDGYMEVPTRSAGSRGTIVTREEFGSCQLHIEFATPAEVSGTSQGRGNSGIMLHGVCEVQVLDSFENDTYPDGQAAAIYSNYPPLVNASRKPGQWQTYDIILELARPVDSKPAESKPTTATAAGPVDAVKKAVSMKTDTAKAAATKAEPVKTDSVKPAAATTTPVKPKLRPARITVLHNGVIVQHAEELSSTATKFKLALQDHNNPVRYRNIWIRPLKERE